MELTRSVLPSQRCALSTEYHHDSRSSRQPLRESNGNAQTHNHRATALCSQTLSRFTTALSPPSIPTPPVVPTQSLESHYGAAGSLRLRRQQLQMQRRQRHGINPIYLSPGFHAYRKKQAEKEAQIWPDVLEDAFLDALLLIPQMGRRKYTMRGQQHGRNMLISEYLWVAYRNSLAPGQKPDMSMKRTRKQVSSHIQVLKGFFTFHRAYHFFFAKEKREKEDRKDPIENESFKENPVLTALAEGRLPEERPNYEYFAQLLASDSLVAIRPSLCWILVSSTAVNVEVDGPLRGEGYKSDGEQLDPDKYPHLPLNLRRDEWPERGKIIRGTLLQEYTRTLTQEGASSVKELSQDWEENFPDLFQALDEVVQDNLRDILHFHVTLDVQEPDRFPEASELNALVEITVEQPALQNHNWKSITRLARPWELTRDTKTDPPTVEIHKEVGNQYMHRPGCENRENLGHCDCSQAPRLRRQQLAVPFPADEWATMLSHLAQYRKHPRDGKPRVKVEYNDSGDAKGGGSADAYEPTQIDLVRKVAMFQELWSSPPDNSSWTRKAVILWTFETVYSVNDKDKSITKGSAGATWRFITAIDPTSQYHQKQALLSPHDAPPSVSRDTVMSPHPGYQQHMNATMSENFGSAWDTAPSLSLQTEQQQQQQQQQHAAQPSQHNSSVSLPPYDAPPSLSLLDAYSNGLTTPPPSATLSSSYPNNFDTSHHHELNSQLGYLSTTAAAADRDSILAITGSSSVADSSYLSATADIGVYEDGGVVDMTNPLQGWDQGIASIDSRLESWTSGFELGTSSQPAGPSMLGWSSDMPQTTTSSSSAGGSSSDLKVSASHWAAAAAPASTSGGGGGGGGGGPGTVDDWGTSSTTTPASEYKPEHWGFKDASSSHGWMSSAGGTSWEDALQEPQQPHSQPQQHQQQQHQQQQVSQAQRNQQQQQHQQHQHQHQHPLHPDFTTGLSPFKGLKRSRTDSLDDRENYPLSAIPKLALHLNVTGGKYPQAASAAAAAPTAIMDSVEQGEASDVW